MLTQSHGGVLASGGSTQLLLSCDAPLHIAAGAASTTVRVGPRHPLTVALQQTDGFGEPPRAWTARAVRRRLRATEEAWRSWSSLHQAYRGPYSDLVATSGLVLQGLMHARTGAIVAAATTSLPEGVGPGAPGTTATPGSGTRA